VCATFLTDPHVERGFRVNCELKAVSTIVIQLADPAKRPTPSPGFFTGYILDDQMLPSDRVCWNGVTELAGSQVRNSEAHGL